jgi:hypothetical protein
MQPTLDESLRCLNPEAAVGVEETDAMEDSDSTDVLRPDLVRPEDKSIFGAQPLQRRHVSSMTRYCASP